MYASLGPQNDVSTIDFNPMVFLSRYQHITQQVLDKVDIKTLKNGRLVSKSWQEVIDNQKILWKNHVGTRAFQLACENNHSRMAEILVKNSTRFSIDLNAKDFDMRTSFLNACINGYSKIAKMIVMQSLELDIDLNTEDSHGRTAFHYVCMNGNSNIAEMIVKKSIKFKIDLNLKDKDGFTAFHWATKFGYSDIVCLIVNQSQEFNIDLNTNDRVGKTAFHHACMDDHPEIQGASKVLVLIFK